MSLPFKKSRSDYDKFVYRVSHDLQEPARGVKSFLTLLEKSSNGKLDGSAKLYLKKAQEQTEDLQQMLKELLVLSRVGRNNESLEHIEVLALLHKLVKRYHSDLANNKWVFDLPKELTIWASKGEMLQLFGAICDNWSQHSPEATMIFSFEQNAKMKSICIDHSPVDVHASLTASIFDVFFTTKKQDGHSGTGLTLVKAIVENLGGYVEATSSKSNHLQLYLHFPE